MDQKKGDYLFTVRGNQKMLLSDAEDYFYLESFSLQHTTINKAYGRIEKASIWVGGDELKRYIEFPYG